MPLGQDVFLLFVGGLFTACIGLFDKRANAERMALTRSLARYVSGMFLCLSLMLLTIACLALRFLEERKLDTTSTAVVLILAIELGKVRDNARRLLTVLSLGKELLAAMQDYVADEGRVENFLVDYSSGATMVFETLEDSNFMKNGVLMMLLSCYNMSSILWTLFGCCGGQRNEEGCGPNNTEGPRICGHIVKTVAKSLLVVIGRIAFLAINLLTTLIGTLVLAVGVAMMLFDLLFACLVYYNITRHVPRPGAERGVLDVKASIEEIFGGIEGERMENISIKDLGAQVLHTLTNCTMCCPPAGHNEDTDLLGGGDFDGDNIKNKILTTLGQCAERNRIDGEASPHRRSWLKVIMKALGLGKVSRPSWNTPRNAGAQLPT